MIIVGIIIIIIACLFIFFSFIIVTCMYNCICVYVLTHRSFDE